MLRREAVVCSLVFFSVLGSTVHAQVACDSYAAAGKAFHQEKFAETLEGYESCLKATPDDPKLRFMVGLVYEAVGDFGNAIKHWSDAIALDPFYQELLRNRFDPNLPGVGRGVIHDHFGQKFCYGLFFVGADKIVYRSLWGVPRLGTDDSFVTSLSNIARVEVKSKERGRGWISNMPKRTELHFRFEEDIKGETDDWSRNEMKFFFGVTQLTQLDLREFAQNLLKYLESRNVTLQPKQ